MNIKETIHHKLTEIVQSLYQLDDQNDPKKVQLEVQETNPDHDGDFTIVTFPLVKVLKKSPDLIAVELGDALETQTDFV